MFSYTCSIQVLSNYQTYSFILAHFKFIDCLSNIFIHTRSCMSLLTNLPLKVHILINRKLAQGPHGPDIRKKRGKTVGKGKSRDGKLGERESWKRISWVGQVEKKGKLGRDVVYIE